MKPVLFVCSLALTACGKKEPPKNAATEYGKALATSVEKAKEAQEKANQAIAAQNARMEDASQLQ